MTKIINTSFESEGAAKTVKDAGFEGQPISNDIRGELKGDVEVLLGLKEELSPEDIKASDESSEKLQRIADLLDRVAVIVQHAELPIIEVKTYEVDGEELVITTEDIRTLQDIMEEDRQSDLERSPEEALKLNGYILVSTVDGRDAISFVTNMEDYLRGCKQSNNVSYSLFCRRYPKI